MKTFWLKKVRRDSWNKYNIVKSDAGNTPHDKPWCIHISQKWLLDAHFATREEAVNYVKGLWHEEASKFLWENRSKRKLNKYPW